MTYVLPDINISNIFDANDNKLITFTSTASAVNEISITNSITGVNARIGASGEATRGVTIHDSNGTDLLILNTLSASAVNQFTINTTISGIYPNISASGSDSVIGMRFVTKGLNSYVSIGSTSGSSTGVLRLEDNSGGQYIALKPNAATTSRTHTLPDIADSTIAVIAGAQTFTNKTLTSPIINQITTDGTEEMLRFIDGGTAVNEFTITNASTATNPQLSATGDDTNIGIDITTKGTGVVNISAGSSAVSGEIRILDKSGGQYVGISVNGTTTSYTLTMPSVQGAVDEVLRNDGTGILSWSGTTSNIRIFTDEKTSGTAGGTFTAGAWQTRDLNTSVGNLTGTSLATNQFTLPAGIYLIKACAVSSNVELNQTRIQNVTDATTAGIGTISRTEDLFGTPTQNCANVSAYVDIALNKTFELQHRCSTTNADDGYGQATGWGTEVYAIVTVTKLGN